MRNEITKLRYTTNIRENGLNVVADWAMTGAKNNNKSIKYVNFGKRFKTDDLCTDSIYLSYRIYHHNNDGRYNKKGKRFPGNISFTWHNTTRYIPMLYMLPVQYPYAH